MEQGGPMARSAGEGHRIVLQIPGFGLASTLSALYPKKSEEKRLVDAMPPAMPK